MTSELEEITSEWRDIAEKFRENMLFGNAVEEARGRGLSTDTTPDKIAGAPEFNTPEPEAVRVRLNFGTMKYHLLDLSIYFYVDLNNFEGQMYVIVPSYIPAEQVPPDTRPLLASEVTKKKFDYRDANIRQLLIEDIKNAFESLNRVFNAQF